MEKDILTDSIIGCAMKIHNTLGNGFQPQRRRDAKKNIYIMASSWRLGVFAVKEVIYQRPKY